MIIHIDTDLNEMTIGEGDGKVLIKDFFIEQEPIEYSNSHQEVISKSEVYNNYKETSALIIRYGISRRQRCM